MQAHRTRRAGAPSARRRGSGAESKQARRRLRGSARGSSGRPSCCGEAALRRSRQAAAAAARQRRARGPRQRRPRQVARQSREEGAAKRGTRAPESGLPCQGPTCCAPSPNPRPCSRGEARRREGEDPKLKPANLSQNGLSQNGTAEGARPSRLSLRG